MLRILTFYTTCSRTQLHTCTHNGCAPPHFKWSVIRTTKVLNHFLHHALLPGDVAILSLRQAFSHQPLTVHRPGFYPRPVHMEFVGNKVSLQHVSLQVLHFSSQYHCTTAPLTSVQLPPAQHNFLVNTAAGQTLSHSFLQHSPHK